MTPARGHQDRESLLPAHMSELPPRRLRAFASFLHQSGAEIFLATGSHEVFRFRALGRMATIYRRSDGSLSFAGPVAEAWQAFVTQCGYRARPMVRHSRARTRRSAIWRSNLTDAISAAPLSERFNLSDFTDSLIADLDALRAGKISVRDARARAELARQVLRAVHYVITAERFLEGRARELAPPEPKGKSKK